MEEIRFDTKIAVVLRDDLLPWQELNVTAFLMSGIAANPELLGEPYEDADGQRYLPLLRQPVVVLTADAATLGRVHGKIVSRGMPLAVYTHDMFSTGHDAANRATVAAVPTAELDLVGIAVHGPKNPVDKALKGTRLHD
ncbi:MAG: DUF2000 domain-containing protein [Propionibacteriales bacterium]|nr:DUF2000 domain-containing protein [Propionibacteriales bacterium]